jgi:hypothetical protein
MSDLVMSDPETEDGSTGRPHTLTATHQPDEAFNIQSPERTRALTELKEAIRKDAVKAPFWGCMQVCDLSKLQELLVAACTSPALFALLEDSCLSIPLRWMRRPPRDQVSSTPSTLSSNAASNGKAPRNTRVEKLKKLAQERDQNMCVLTKHSVHEVAHIFPRSMIVPKPPTNLESSIPPFWKLLDCFFEPDRLNRWRSQIFKDPSDPTKATDGCHNLICLSPDAHALWARGMFALRPISLSNDRKELLVQFYWQPRPSHDRFGSVNLVESPGSSEGLISVERNVLVVGPGDITAAPQTIKSGDTFLLTTTDPDTRPLPSFDLLEMQWHLQRIVSMSGAAGIYEDDDYDDDDDNDCDDDRAVSKTYSDIISWLGDDNGRYDHSVTTISTSPSPVKTRECQAMISSTEAQSAEV